MTDFYHTPVLVCEVMEGLRIGPGKRFIDATVGGGGHGIEIVRRGGTVLGIDVDREAIEYVRRKLEVGSPPAGEAGEKLDKRNITLVQGNFRDVRTIAQEHGFPEVDGIVFDLGVSSHQLDTKERGFSYRYSQAPIDMRLDQKHGIAAAEYLNRLSERELYEIFTTFGEEERAGAIAHAIVGARSVTPIATVGHLRTVIVGVTGEDQGVLSRIFQALRIAANDELRALDQGLVQAFDLVRQGGRVAVISFHSLEDRRVKRAFQKSGWQMITKKPVVASDQERQRNVRARSAKLRIAEKI